MSFNLKNIWGLALPLTHGHDTTATFICLGMVMDYNFVLQKNIYGEGFKSAHPRSM